MTVPGDSDGDSAVPGAARPAGRGRGLAGTRGRAGCLLPLRSGRGGSAPPTGAAGRAAYLLHRDVAQSRQFLLGFLARIGIGQVGIEVIIQELNGLFTKVSPSFPARK